MIKKELLLTPDLINCRLPDARKITVNWSVDCVPSRAFSSWASGRSYAEQDRKGLYTNSVLEEVDICYCVKEISENAFEGCEALRKVLIPSSITRIGEGAFAYCGSLEEVAIPSQCVGIAPSLFSHCFSLRKVGGVKGSIGKSAFYKCEALRDVELKDVAEIGESAFFGCKSLKTIDLTSTTSLGKQAFYQCEALQNIELRGVAEIGESAFYGCKSLRTIDLTSAISIGKKAFRYCSSIMNVSFSKRLRTIEEGAFSNCTSLSTVSLPEYLSSIGNSAFNSAGLVEITIPGSVCIIEECAFEWCDKLERVTICEGVQHIGKNAFSACHKLREITLPSSIKTIADGAFSYTKIASITLPKGIETIGKRAFASCSITEVELPTSIRSIQADSFDESVIITISGMLYEDYLQVQSADAAILSLQKQIADKSTIYAAKIKQIAEIEGAIQDAKNSVSAISAEIAQLRSKIKNYNDETASAIGSAESSKKDAEQKAANIRKTLTDITTEETQLHDQRKSTFILAVSKRKELSLQLTSLAEKKAKLHEELLATEEDIRINQGRIDAILSQVASMEKQALELSSKMQQKQDDIRRLKEKKQALATESESIESGIKADDEVLQDRMKEYSELLSSKRNRVERRRLEREKAGLIKAIGYSKMDLVNLTCVINHPEAVPNGAYIYRLLIGIQQYKAAVTEAEKTSALSKKHRKKIQRIVDINGLIGLEKNDGIEELMVEDFSLQNDTSREQIENLNELFEFDPVWDELMTCLASSSTTTQNTRIAPFLGLNSFVVSGKWGKQSFSSSIVMLPFCLILLSPTKASDLQIAFYSDTMITCASEEKTHKAKTDKWNAPSGCEVLSRHYLHENLDGTPNKRYKDNPITFTVRHTELKLQCGDLSFAIEVNGYEEAKRFEELYNDHVIYLKRSRNKSIIDLLLEPDGEVQLDRLISLKKQRREMEERLEQERRAAEKKEIENRRIAEEQARLERRKAIIEKQRSIIEASRTNNDAENINQSTNSMFYDEEFSATGSGLTPDITTNSSIIEVVGSRTITNNVFKIKLVQKIDDRCGDVKIFFSDTEGTVISNSRNISFSGKGEESVVGFVLNSGIDFTKMKACVLNIQYNDAKMESIAFKMNISFYSDF